MRVRLRLSEKLRAELDILERKRAEAHALVDERIARAINELHASERQRIEAQIATRIQTQAHAAHARAAKNAAKTLRDQARAAKAQAHADRLAALERLDARLRSKH